MGSAVSAITKPIGGITGGLTKGLTGPTPQAQGTQINEGAFDPLKEDKRLREQKKIVQSSFLTGDRFGGKLEAQGAARQQSQQLAEQLQRQARGEGPSLAEAQLRSASDRSLAQQLAAAGRSRGGSSAALQRQLAQQQAASGQELAQQAAVARMQEQQAAQGLAGQLLGQMRGQDIQLAGQRVQAELQQQAQQVQNQQFFEQLALQAAQGDRASQQALEQLRVQQNLGIQGMNIGAQTAAQQAQSQLTGGLIQAGATAAMMSDKNSKKNMKSYSDKDLKKAMKKEKKSQGDDFSPSKFLDALKAQSYEYKDSHKSKEGAGEGRFLGVMAQDLEKAGKVGKSMVKNTNEGKMVDFGKGFGAILAAQAHLNERLKELESKKKKKK